MVDPVFQGLREIVALWEELAQEENPDKPVQLENLEEPDLWDRWEKMDVMVFLEQSDNQVPEANLANPVSLAIRE